MRTIAAGFIVFVLMACSTSFAPWNSERRENVEIGPGPNECNESMTACFLARQCASLGGTCRTLAECCPGLICDTRESQCRLERTACVQYGEQCDPEKNGLDCCDRYAKCVEGKCESCTMSGRPTSLSPCCEKTLVDEEGDEQCGGCSMLGRKCDDENPCCAAAQCVVKGEFATCRRISAPFGSCYESIDCPPETPICESDFTSPERIGRCRPGTSRTDSEGADGGQPTASLKKCSADWECLQEAGDACCLVPSHTASGESLPSVGGRQDFCDESKKNTCYRGYVCADEPKKCLGSANPLVCAGCDKKCTADGFCDRTWEGNNCADCLNLCTPCVKNGVKLECGIDPVCGTGTLCGACTNCNPETFKCDATPNACGRLCANIRNCAAVQAVYGSVTCNCLPDFACTKGNCSPNGLMCEETTLSIGDSFDKEPCKWCGGHIISTSQCIACGGYIQATKCMGLNSSFVSPDCFEQ